MIRLRRGNKSPPERYEIALDPDARTLDEALELAAGAIDKPAASKRGNGAAVATNDDGEHVPGIYPEAPIEDVLAALALIPNDDRAWEGDDGYNTIGMAIFRATEGSDEGFAAFDAWSKQSTKHNSKKPEDFTEARWDHWTHSSEPDRVGFGKLVYLARRADPDFRPPSWSRVVPLRPGIGENVDMGAFPTLPGAAGPPGGTPPSGPTPSPEAGAAPQSGMRSRVLIRIIPGQMPAVIDAAEGALIAADPDVYAFGQQVVRPVIREIRIADKRKTRGLQLVPIASAHMCERFDRVVDFRKYSKTAKSWVPADCPDGLAGRYLERIGLWRLPQLRGLTACPLLRPDGSILDQPGFDAATGMLFEPQGVTFPGIAARPSRDDAFCALKFLEGLFPEFPFVDEANRSVLRSGILSSVSRLALGPIPAHGFSAPAAGTGKSKLVDCISLIVSGRECAVVSQAKDEVEFEKKIGAVLLAGDAMVSIDNCQQAIDSQFLCMVLTQPEVQIRILGLSKMALIPNGTMVFATGNNFSFSGDMLRRGLRSTLDAGVERPELRTFTTEDPISVLKRERGRYVAAALTIVRAYMVSGQPNPPQPALGGFELWSDRIRGVLAWLDRADPIDTIEAARAVDPELQQIEAVITQWASVIGTGKMLTAREVIDVANEVEDDALAVPNCYGRLPGAPKHSGLQNALLDAAVGEHGTISVQRLGNWLRLNKDKVSRGHRIAAGTDKFGIGRWVVQRKDGNRWV